MPGRRTTAIYSFSWALLHESLFEHAAVRVTREARQDEIRICDLTNRTHLCAKIVSGQLCVQHARICRHCGVAAAGTVLDKHMVNSGMHWRSAAAKVRLTKHASFPTSLQLWARQPHLGNDDCDAEQCSPGLSRLKVWMPSSLNTLQLFALQQLCHKSEMVRASYYVLCCALICAPVKAALEAADSHDDRQLAVCVLFQRSVSLPRLRRRSDPHSQ